MEVKQLAFFLTTLMVTLATSVRAEEPPTLGMPVEMIENGFAKHLLPRFALRSRIRLTPVPEQTGATMELALTPQGDDALFADDKGRMFGVTALSATAAPTVQTFVDWLRSDVGQAAIAAFPLGQAPLYTPVTKAEEPDAVWRFDGDIDNGLALSRKHCQRCHVVHPSKPFAGIGSTPSFAALKSIPEWQETFTAFYLANPHRGLIEVEGLTDPETDDRPLPIAPIVVTLDQIDDILAYLNSLKPKDLGAPVRAYQE